MRPVFIEQCDRLRRQTTGVGRRCAVADLWHETIPTNLISNDDRLVINAVHVDMVDLACGMSMSRKWGLLAKFSGNSSAALSKR